MAEYVAAIDQGTTGTRCLLVDHDGLPVADAYERHEQHYPEPGWVEHDPREIRTNVRQVLSDAVDEAGVGASSLAALGVANQRETTILWDRETGAPLSNAIVWQDRRTTDRIERIEADGTADWIRATTGLEPDAYFSASKLEWLLDELHVRDRAAAGELCFGTVDSWLLADLVGDHVTDVTNASRTMLFDIHDLSWDDDLLAEFDVPRPVLPEVRPSSTVFGHTDPDGFLDASVPVASILGDQQAALFGQTCFDAGDAKNTFGTGSFVLANTGTQPATSDHGLITTVAFQREGQPAQYALEGSIFVTGGAIEWLVDLDLIEDAAETEQLARSVDSTDGVFVVPAFAGLGAPYWDPRARGTVVGLTRGTRREHLVRAVLESLAYRTHDVTAAMAADTGESIESLRVDGGAVENDVLCQLLADTLGAEVIRPVVQETTALGAAFAAGLAVGFWDDVDELRATWQIDRRFTPDDAAREAADDRYDRWADAVERARDWAYE